MITTNLKGGLGNQMFQYACGRALALRNNDELFLVRTVSTFDKKQPFLLPEFNIQGQLVSAKQVSVFQKLKKIFEQKILRRFYVNFVPSVVSKSGNVYLDGYYQSEKYFADKSETIRQDLVLKTPLTGKALAMAEQIKSDPNSVSLHVRRSDYVTHSDFGGIADQEYYDKAIKELTSHIPNPHFYVFSDELDWCRVNLALGDHTTFVLREDMGDHEAMFMMSLCRHNIIANSSFSWWGAWLNRNPQKIVIAPKKWSNIHFDWYRDIIPKSWIRV